MLNYYYRAAAKLSAEFLDRTALTRRRSRWSSCSEQPRVNALIGVGARCRTDVVLAFVKVNATDCRARTIFLEA
jgi:hypothetical protein